jgi:hypothetical protein
MSYTLTLAQIESLKPEINGTVVDWSSEIEIINYDESITNLSHKYEVKALTEDAEKSLELQGFGA